MSLPCNICDAVCAIGVPPLSLSRPALGCRRAGAYSQWSIWKHGACRGVAVPTWSHHTRKPSKWNGHKWTARSDAANQLPLFFFFNSSGDSLGLSYVCLAIMRLVMNKNKGILIMA